MENGEWRMESGEWRVESGEWAVRFLMFVDCGVVLETQGCNRWQQR